MNFSWFLDPIQQHYADFEGRASRKVFWMFILYYFIITIILSVITEMTGLGFIETIIGLILILPSLAISARRLHDVNKSAWWLLLNLTQLISVPIFFNGLNDIKSSDFIIILLSLIGPLVIVFFTVKKGSVGDNQYGKDPLASEVSSSIPVTPPQPTPLPPTTPTV